MSGVSAVPTENRAHTRWFRNIAPYINAHRGKTFVLMLDGEAAEHPNFATIVHDIALLNSLGVRLLLVYGARTQIAARLAAAGHSSDYHDRLRVTDAVALEHVRDAVGSLRSRIEALLSMGLPNSPMQGAEIRVCGGNFVTARPIGVRDGVDFQFTGRVRRIDTAAIARYLDDGAIVLIPTLGYSPTGETFNLALEDVAVQCAAAIHADKLLLLNAEKGLANGDGDLVRQCSLSEVPALASALSPPQRALLETAAQACRLGVKRCHLISFADDCALLEELFTHDGSGTLVSADPFERSRRAVIDDVGGILELLDPLEREGVLVKRSRELLETEIGRFRLLERDGRILACAALYPFVEDRCGEIACIVTHPEYRRESRAQRLLAELEAEARSLGLNRVFVLTTQTAHWFLEQGFALQERDALPAERQKLYNLQRNSKVLFKYL